MREPGLETTPRFPKCCNLECALAGQCQPTNQPMPGSERSCFEEMARDLAGAFADCTRIGQLDRVGDARMQLLLTWGRNAHKQRLTYKLVGEGKRLLRSLRARDDYSHLLRLFDDGKKIVNVDQAHAGQKLKAETAPDDCGGCQHALFIVLEALQTAADDQPHVFGNVALVDFDVSAELAGGVKDFSILDQMPV